LRIHESDESLSIFSRWIFEIDFKPLDAVDEVLEPISC
ncbi:hypothetical protein Tco_1364679, partial [Tanacetum coccineum]